MLIRIENHPIGAVICDPITPADVYVHGQAVGLPKWQGWAKAARQKLNAIVEDAHCPSAVDRDRVAKRAKPKRRRTAPGRKGDRLRRPRTGWARQRRLVLSMLSIGALASAAQGASYYEGDGYNAKDDPEHREASAWARKGAEELGLEGEVDADVFRAVPEGKVPDGSER